MNQKEIRNYLITRAKLGTIIHYGSLNQLLDTPYDLSYSYERHLLGEDLGDTVRADLYCLQLLLQKKISYLVLDSLKWQKDSNYLTHQKFPRKNF